MPKRLQRRADAGGRGGGGERLTKGDKIHGRRVCGFDDDISVTCSLFAHNFEGGTPRMPSLCPRS
jgi:hypothetical protein